MMCVNFAQPIHAQIFSWSAFDLSQPMDNCVLPDYTTFIEHINASNGITLKDGIQKPIVVDAECSWKSGQFVGAQPVWVIDKNIEPNFLSGLDKFIVLGDATYIVNSATTTPITPSSTDLIELYSAIEFFFDFPIDKQYSNFFYNLRLKMITLGYSGNTIALGTNTDYGTNYSPWISGSIITNTVLNNLQNEVSLGSYDPNSDWSFLDIPFYIEEESEDLFLDDTGPGFGLDNYNTQIGVALLKSAFNFSPSAQFPYLIIVESMELDCDIDNIVFNFNVAPCNLEELNDCDDMKYCLELTTNCAGFDISDFVYNIDVYNSNWQYIKSVAGTGFNTQFSLNELPSGDYYLRLNYNTSNGKNIKVANAGLYAEKLISHQQILTYDITGSTIISQDIKMPLDIYVKNGAVLRVLATVSFKDNKSLYVEDGGKLIVQDQGHLTACDTEWGGVQAIGKAEVEVKSNGSVSKAYWGIVGYGDQKTIVNIDNADFFDNRVSLLLFDKTEPVIKNSNFTGGDRGMYLINVTGGTTANGVLIEGNQFLNHRYQGISSFSTLINVINGNHFENCSEGIGLYNLFGRSAQAIIGISNSLPNSFNLNKAGIYTVASHQSIWNNLFTNNEYGGYYSGINTSWSKENVFNSGQHGEAFYSTGARQVGSESNYYQTDGGIFTWQENDNYIFVANCFNTLWYDMNTVGTINAAQGSPAVAASNCFTGSNVPDFLCNTPYTVDYFVPKSNINYPVCLKPNQQTNYQRREDSDTYRDSNCNPSTGDPYVGEYDHILISGCDSTLLFTLFDSINNHITSLEDIQVQEPLTTAQKALLLTLKRHKRFIIAQWADCLRKDIKFNQLYNWYASFTDRDYAISKAETKVMMGEYNAAKIELQNVWSLYGGDLKVLRGLIYNIMEIEQSGNFIPSSSQLDTLRDAASTYDPYAAYARALLYLKTDERIDAEPDTSLIPRGAIIENDFIDELKIKVYPNPVSDILYIHAENSSNPDSTYEIRLYDTFGRVAAYHSITLPGMIPTTHLQTGLYFIKIDQGANVLLSSKLVILK